MSSFIAGYETFELIAEKHEEQLVMVPQNQRTILHIAVARQDLYGNYHKDSVLLSLSMINTKNYQCV